VRQELRQAPIGDWAGRRVRWGAVGPAESVEAELGAQARWRARSKDESWAGRGGERWGVLIDDVKSGGSAARGAMPEADAA